MSPGVEVDVALEAAVARFSQRKPEEVGVERIERLGSGSEDGNRFHVPRYFDGKLLSRS